MRASGGATGRRAFVKSGTPAPSATSRTADTPGSVRTGAGEAVAAPGAPPGMTSTGGGVGAVAGAPWLDGAAGVRVDVPGGVAGAVVVVAVGGPLGGVVD